VLAENAAITTQTATGSRGADADREPAAGARMLTAPSGPVAMATSVELIRTADLRPTGRRLRLIERVEDEPRRHDLAAVNQKA